MKNVLLSLIGLVLSIVFLNAQNDTMYIMKGGIVIGKYNVNNQVDSIIFYKPFVNTTPLGISFVDIPAGTFTMGSPTSEPNHNNNEIEHLVTLSTFKISMYEITNAQFVDFLNAKEEIAFNGWMWGETPILYYQSSGLFSRGGIKVAQDNSWEYKWMVVAGYENHPVVDVTWFGAYEFAKYIGATLPTEAQWEYACRGNTTSAFNTGACLSNTQANYDWLRPQYDCINTNTNIPGKPQKVGSYSPNAFGLYDMHGNVSEWCNDWYGAYPSFPQNNPTGPAYGTARVTRGGFYYSHAEYCRSAERSASSESGALGLGYGFRVVLAP